MYGWTDKKGEQARKTMMFRVGKQKSGLRIEPRGFGRSSGAERSERGGIRSQDPPLVEGKQP